MAYPFRAIETQAEIDAMPPFTFPNYEHREIPDGWRQTDSLFCDHSGVGQRDEAALTIPQTQANLRVGRAYAIIGVGQFQLHLGEYERIQTNEVFQTDSRNGRGHSPRPALPGSNR